MDITAIQNWMNHNPELAFGAAALAGVLSLFIVRYVIGKGLFYFASRTETKYDDIIVEKLKPYRVSYIALLMFLYGFAYLLPDYEHYIKTGTLFFTLWVVIVTINSLLNALNDIYESSPSFTGVAIQGYLDIVKLLFLLVGIILSISLFTGESPLVLLSGLGAITAILLLVFRDTILSLVASVQISSQGLVKEGDWIEVPSYEADGDVVNMSLHTIKVQNFDMTITVIPTYKMMEVAYKNWRGMQESGGRRIKRAIYIDLHSVRLATDEMLTRWKKIELLRPYLEEKEKSVQEFNQSHGVDSAAGINGRQLTNVGTFRAYMEAYVRSREEIHQDKLSLLVRELAPGPQGLPIEIYAFTKTTVWGEFERIQADIFDHLLAAAREFDLLLFQEATMLDYKAFGISE
jgi:miniconductance mechanosensitive channel